MRRKEKSPTVPSSSSSILTANTIHESSVQRATSIIRNLERLWSSLWKRRHRWGGAAWKQVSQCLAFTLSSLSVLQLQQAQSYSDGIVPLNWQRLIVKHSKPPSDTQLALHVPFILYGLFFSPPSSLTAAAAALGGMMSVNLSHSSGCSEQQKPKININNK